jgi:hypothetical protein
VDDGRLLISETGVGQGQVISPFLANIYLHHGAPGQTWCFQRVKFPPRQEVQPPHRESSLGSAKVTTWTKRRQSDARAVTKVKQISLVKYLSAGRQHRSGWQAPVGSPQMARWPVLRLLPAQRLEQRVRSTLENAHGGVALDSWHPTEGTRRTRERNTARRMVVSGGRLEPLIPAPAVRRWRFPPPFGDQSVASVPLSEIINISKHIPATRIESFMNEAPLQDLNRADTPPPLASEPNGRSSQAFAMDVYAKGDGLTKRIAAFGHDIYGVSGPIVVEARMRVLSKPPRVGGAYAPAELFEPRQFLSALNSDIRVEDGGDSSPLGIATRHR